MSDCSHAPCTAGVVIARTGRPRRYCSNKCRQAAYRARHRKPRTDTARPAATARPAPSNWPPPRDPRQTASILAAVGLDGTTADPIGSLHLPRGWSEPAGEYAHRVYSEARTRLQEGHWNVAGDLRGTLEQLAEHELQGKAARAALDRVGYLLDVEYHLRRAA